jgi:hypothetical protein
MLSPDEKVDRSLKRLLIRRRGSQVGPPLVGSHLARTSDSLYRSGTPGSSFPNYSSRYALAAGFLTGRDVSGSSSTAPAALTTPASFTEETAQSTVA